MTQEIKIQSIGLSYVAYMVNIEDIIGFGETPEKAIECLTIKIQTTIEFQTSELAYTKTVLQELDNGEVEIKYE